MTITERFVKERSGALLSLGRKRIEAYLIKYGETGVQHELPVYNLSGVLVLILAGHSETFIGG